MNIRKLIRFGAFYCVLTSGENARHWNSNEKATRETTTIKLQWKRFNFSFWHSEKKQLKKFVCFFLCSHRKSKYIEANTFGANYRRHVQQNGRTTASSNLKLFLCYFAFIYFFRSSIGTTNLLHTVNYHVSIAESAFVSPTVWNTAYSKMFRFDSNEFYKWVMHASNVFIMYAKVKGSIELYCISLSFNQMVSPVSCDRECKR